MDRDTGSHQDKVVKDIGDALVDVMEVMTALSEVHGPDKNEWPVGQHSMGCPVCEKGTLRYRVSPRDRYLSVFCDRPGCVTFVE
jgi:hypothetical protein